MIFPLKGKIPWAKCFLKYLGLYFLQHFDCKHHTPTPCNFLMILSSALGYTPSLYKLTLQLLFVMPLNFLRPKFFPMQFHHSWQKNPTRDVTSLPSFSSCEWALWKVNEAIRLRVVLFHISSGRREEVLLQEYTKEPEQWQCSVSIFDPVIFADY